MVDGVVIVVEGGRLGPSMTGRWGKLRRNAHGSGIGRNEGKEREAGGREEGEGGGTSKHQVLMSVEIASH